MPRIGLHGALRMRESTVRFPLREQFGRAVAVVVRDQAGVTDRLRRFAGDHLVRREIDAEASSVDAHARVDVLGAVDAAALLMPAHGIGVLAIGLQAELASQRHCHQGEGQAVALAPLEGFGHAQGGVMPVPQAQPFGIEKEIGQSLQLVSRQGMWPHLRPQLFTQRFRYRHQGVRRQRFGLFRSASAGRK
jgi:hypothetical protein